MSAGDDESAEANRCFVRWPRPSNEMLAATGSSRLQSPDCCINAIVTLSNGVFFFTCGQRDQQPPACHAFAARNWLLTA